MSKLFSLMQEITFYFLPQKQVTFHAYMKQQADKIESAQQT